MVGEKMDEKEKNRLVAIVRVVNGEGELIGGPVEVYKEARIRVNKGVPEVMFKEYGLWCRTFGAFTLEVVPYGENPIPINGVYKRGSNDVVEITVKENTVAVDCVQYPDEPPYKREPGEWNYQPMWPRDKIPIKSRRVELKPNWYLDIKFSDMYRKVGEEGNVPVVDKDVIIRIEARRLEPRKLTRELYQPTKTQ